MHRLTDLLQEVPLLKLDQYGHLLRHTLQDVDVDLNNLDMDLDAQVVSLRLRPANIQAVHICTFARYSWMQSTRFRSLWSGAESCN